MNVTWSSFMSEGQGQGLGYKHALTTLSRHILSLSQLLVFQGVALAGLELGDPLSLLELKAWTTMPVIC